METPAFAAIELKKTHHVLGILSRDADPAGGGDLALLAPRSLTVRAPEEFATNDLPPVPPFQMQVPASQLQAVVVNGAPAALRRQVYANPMNCVVSSDGTVAPVAAGGNVPAFTLKPSGSIVPAFKVDITANTVAELPFTVIIQEANPAPDKLPFICITEGKIAAGQHIADNVLITLVPDENPVLNPIPKGTAVHVLVAVSGRQLVIKNDPNPL